MSGNALFLVCKPCEEADELDFGVRLAERTQIGWYEHRVPGKQLDAWLAKHRKCGGSPDHFVLGHLHAPNGDQLERSPIAKAINGAMQ